MRASAFFSACVIVLLGAACGTRTIDPDSDFDAGSDAAHDGAGDTDTDGASDAPSPAFFACNGEGASCVLTWKGCCDGCSSSLDARIAVAVGQESAYHDFTCLPLVAAADGGWSGCPGTGCGAAPDPNLQAVCRASTCVAIDVTKDAFSACATNADCELHYASCCGSCGPTDVGLIAIAKSQASAYAQAICSPLIDCAPCPGPVQYPAGKRAVCDGTRHCVVQ
jgi:hypothetical protein